MGEIRLVRGLTPEHMRSLLKWANSGGEAFLRQFAGPKWRYPLTEAQVAAEMEEILSIMDGGAFVGIIQRFARRDRSVHLGRFLIDPERKGAGIGTEALKRLCREIFSEGDEDSISLNVYLSNAPARRCYEKCGFRVVRVQPEWSNCRMELTDGNPLYSTDKEQSI